MSLLVGAHDHGADRAWIEGAGDPVLKLCVEGCVANPKTMVTGELHLAWSIFSHSPSATLAHTGRLGGGIRTNSSAFSDDGQ